MDKLLSVINKSDGLLGSVFIDKKYYIITINSDSLLLKSSHRLSLFKYWPLMKFQDVDAPVFSISKVGGKQPSHKYYALIGRQFYLLPGPGRELKYQFINGRIIDVG